MAFELEVIPPAGPSDYLEAHRLAQPRLTVREPNGDEARRWVDRTSGAVMYMSAVFAGREGRSLTFQLIVGTDIVEFSGHAEWIGNTDLNISRVTLPESLNGARKRLAALIIDAVHSFNNPTRAHGLDPLDVSQSTLLLAATWQVTPRPGSPLDLQQQAAAASARRKSQWLRLRWQMADALYPLGMLAACILLRKTDLIGRSGYIALATIAALWLLASLNSDRMRRRMADWFAGRNKSQSYLNLLGDLIITTQQRPVLPYKDLQIAIKTVDAVLPDYEITFTNTGWLPLQMVVGASDLLGMLADGFGALDKLEQRRAVGPYNVEEVAPALGAMRVWGKQSRTVRRRGIKGFLPVTGEVKLTLVNVNKGRPVDIFRVACVATR